MIKNYFKTAARNLVKHKVFTAINISGLAIGIASCLLLFTIVKYELNYNTDQPALDHIYRVVSEQKSESNLNYTPGIPFPALEAVRNDIPQVTTAPLFSSFGSQVTVLGQDPNNAQPQKKFIEENGFFFSDPSFFDVFKIEWLAGKPAVLDEPNITVLSKSTAEKYFGDWRSAVGQYLKLDNAATTQVAGVIENSPPNSDVPVKILSSYKTAQAHPQTYFYFDDWNTTSSNFQLFVLLPENRTTAQTNAQLKSFSEKYFANKKRSTVTSFLQPLSEMHFDRRFESFGDHVIAKSTLWTLSLISLFIIIMACINFINLSTAQAVGRSKEIGIRKVLGGHRKQLFLQVIGETFLIVTIAVLLAVGIAALSLPFIKNVTSISGALSIFSFQNLLLLIAIVIGVTFFAGTYPALILSGFKPVLALKNKITSASVGGISVRRGLVVTQFAISQVLIIGTIVAVSQMKFVRNADLGFDQKAVLNLFSNTDSTSQSRQEYFARLLSGINGVQNVSFSSDVPSSDNNWASNFAFDHKPDEKFALFIKYADENYFDTYGLQFLAGRPYTKSDTTNEVVINLTTVEKLGIQNPAMVLGKEIRIGGQRWKKIVGVVQDFKTNSLKEDIKPLILAQERKYYTVAGVKLNTGRIKETQQQVESSWNNTFPEYAFTQSFMDDSLAEFYKQDEQLALLYQLFAGIAIFISCLGLYGLVSFMAAQKTKEVGIRKVLGASVKNIVYLFSKEFTILIAISFVIAAPLAYYIMSDWLQDFVYRIPMGIGVFILGIVVSVCIAWITVGYKAIKAAVANPVESLRTE